MDSITWWQAVILGLVQGLTEFIPVSSSAHLNITHWLFGGEERFLTYDVLLHVGTLFALIVYFWGDWMGLLFNREKVRLRNLVLVACVPAVLAGVALRDLEDTLPLFKDPRFNAVMLALAGFVLWISDRVGSRQRELEDTNLPDALIIGLSQAVALVPGVSRSGATITAGLFRGLDREAAARFSFLMSVPITLGAVGFEFYGAFIKQTKPVGASIEMVLLGILVSAGSGFWAIGFLLNYLKTRSVTLFVLWRIAVAIAVFTLLPYVRQALLR